jgi:hypothetical protein
MVRMRRIARQKYARLQAISATTRNAFDFLRFATVPTTAVMVLMKSPVKMDVRRDGSNALTKDAFL